MKWLDDLDDARKDMCGDDVPLGIAFYVGCILMTISLAFMLYVVVWGLIKSGLWLPATIVGFTGWFLVKRGNSRGK